MPSADLQQQAAGKVNCGARTQLPPSLAQAEVATGDKDSSTPHVCFVQHLAIISSSQSQRAVWAQLLLLRGLLRHFGQGKKNLSFYGILCISWGTQMQNRCMTQLFKIAFNPGID